MIKRKSLILEELLIYSSWHEAKEAIDKLGYEHHCRVESIFGKDDQRVGYAICVPISGKTQVHIDDNDLFFGSNYMSESSS